MQTTTTTATTASRRRTPPSDSVLHEAASLMRRVWIPAEGLVWRLGARSYLWAIRTDGGELEAGNATSEAEARREIASARAPRPPRGMPLLP